ncbi:SAVED domain-containing protein [Tissierella sp.]|uniref:SAVED domain-containing protein n=1 Tax=Tissierella sp. TaxID=41274 RepID=UPI002856B7F6|nr:SAVED domain-containing protein [Tissierella sp.]MDR7855517.1 SAVED domain-containing protein [Tissierella sp.]
MGGKEASRGFLYQAFASVLEALYKESWDKIYIEMHSANDKVDIALEEDGKIIRSIQVKSTINTFSKESVKKWLQDLIKDDVGTIEFELFLIGQCDDEAITFINSMDKLQSDKLDGKARTSLKGFDTSIIKGKIIKFTCLPFNVNVLEKIVRDSLHQYISYSNRTLTFDQISFIASATVNDQMISSTHGNGIDRKVFDEELEKRIFLVADKYTPKRVSIGVKSFSRGTGQLENETQSCLSLIDKFDGRNLKYGYDWNIDIYKELDGFLISNTCNKQAYQIFLETHSSIAFASGRLFDSKSGVNIFPIQRSSTNGTILWDVKLSSNESYPNWDISHEGLNEGQYDSALILNVTRNIYDDVIHYIKENNLSIGRVIKCTPNINGATNFSIKDGTHATVLANSVYSAIAQRSTAERRATLHIFAAAPNAFMFFLGQNSRGFGKCILYEYDFDQRDSCSYLSSIDFTN